MIAYCSRRKIKPRRCDYSRSLRISAWLRGGPFANSGIVEKVLAWQFVVVGDLKYQRTVVGYHGCDESVVRDVLLRGKHLKPSHNDYDWLGRGIHFWEHGPQRAYEWAKHSKTLKSLR